MTFEGVPPERTGSVKDAGSGAVSASADGEREIGLDDLWRILRRRAWIIAGTVVLVTGLAALYAITRPQRWEASALIRVETNPARLFQDPTLGSAGRDDIETEMRVVTTRPVLERVVDGLDLVLRVEEPRGAPRDSLFSTISFGRHTPRARYELTREADGFRLRALAPDTLRVGRSFRAGEPVEIPGGRLALAGSERPAGEGGGAPERLVLSTVRFDDAVEGLGGGLTTSRPNPRVQLFRVAYRGPDPVLATDIVNGVVEAYLAERQTARAGEARSAVAFLRDQAAQVEAELEAAEESLQQFRERQQVVALDAEAQQQVSRLADLEAGRAQLAAERNALSNLLETIAAADRESAAAGDGPARADTRSLVAFPTFLQNETVGTLIERLIEAETRRTELRERWSPAHPGIVALDSTIVELEARLGEIGRDYLASLDDQIASLDAERARFGAELEEVPGRELQFARLERQVRLLNDLHSLLQQRLKEAEISEALEDPAVSVVEAAALPRRPVSPRLTPTLALAGILGVLLGVGLAFVREGTDPRLHGDDDVERLLGVPVLARVPPVRTARTEGNAPPLVVVAEGGWSPGAEAFRTLRASLIHGSQRPDGDERLELLVTSPGTREGKTLVAASLAAALALQGRRTLLVDADLRRSEQHRIFGVEPRPGLSELMAGEAGLDEVTRRTDVPGLDIVPSGRSRPDPTGLLGGPPFAAFLDGARDRYEAIVLDSPPTLAVADATILAGAVKGVLLVLRAERTDRRAARDAIEQLRRAGSRLRGIVLNGARPDARYGSGYASYVEGRGTDRTWRSRLRARLPFAR